MIERMRIKIHDESDYKTLNIYLNQGWEITHINDVVTYTQHKIPIPYVVSVYHLKKEEIDMEQTKI